MNDDDFSPHFYDLMIDLLFSSEQGINEIPVEVWAMEHFDIAAYLGVVAALPRCTFIGYPPKLVWDTLEAYLRHAAKSYESLGEISECYRRARQGIQGLDKLWSQYQSKAGAVVETLWGCNGVAWPLQNLRIETRIDGQARVSDQSRPA